ncbi:MAG: thioredoxin domain-containing protein [Chitinophagales bacterium]|nr:thioredoxin domain-containing protein [Chitinophagales bacterium]
MPNRLINEQSPYLLQHAHNPVDWHPWGDEAFDIAKRENKPVLVSIGYAACHWCHVMERESFEDEATAKYMNEHFVCIKVDREEHPDVDHMYMDAVQAITQSGGWPLNAFVTPDRVPFYGGTYFPPKPMYGRASWMQVMERIYDVWQNKQEEVSTQTEQMLGYLKQISQVALNGKEYWDKDACLKSAENLLQQADRRYGGFGPAPKFPGTMSIGYLLEHHHFTGNEDALQHALFSIDCMINGGIYDQVGGGFARYSVDEQWLAPHFEKMLYDNALLVSVMADAYTITQNKKYSDAIRETIAFANRELLSEEGGFYSALDADSEGVEGKFYTWTWEEWNELKLSEIVTNYFDVSETGNWEHTNILRQVKTVQQAAEESGKTTEEINTLIDEAKQIIFAKRAERIRPATDDKCLLAWNALMNIALTKAGVALDDNAYMQQAGKHLQWMYNTYHKEGVWTHTYKNGVARIHAKLDDLAFLIDAMITYASATGENTWVEQAAGITEMIQADFLHDNKSFFYYNSVKQKDIPVRKTDLYDGALPSANSVMAGNLITLGMTMENSAWLEQGIFMTQKMCGQSMRYTTSFSNWATLGQRYVAGLQLAIITGNATDNIHEMLRKTYLPNNRLLVKKQGVQGLPIMSGKEAGGDVAVFVCDMESCRPPESSYEGVLKIMRKLI